jgi:AraC-like DNA-binding protein
MDGLVDQSVGLSSLLNPSLLREVEDRLAECGNHNQRIQVVETFLLSLQRARVPDGAVRKAVRLLQAKPSMDLASMAGHLGLGERQLERSPPSLETAMDQGFFDQSHFIKEFRAYAGTTPEAWMRAQHRPRDQPPRPLTAKRDVGFLQ